MSVLTSLLISIFLISSAEIDVRRTCVHRERALTYLLSLYGCDYILEVSFLPYVGHILRMCTFHYLFILIPALLLVGAISSDLNRSLYILNRDRFTWSFISFKDHTASGFRFDHLFDIYWDIYRLGFAFEKGSWMQLDSSFSGISRWNRRVAFAENAIAGAATRNSHARYPSPGISYLGRSSLIVRYNT